MIADFRALVSRFRALVGDRDRLALGALCAAHVALSLALSGSGIFAKYPNLAAHLRRGDLTPAQASDASPGYLLLHLVLEPQTIRWLQALAAAAGLVCAFRVAGRARGAVAAWTAAGALALAQPWLVYSAVLEPDAAVAVLNAAALACLALGSPQRLRASAFAGAALGLSFALRPTAALFALVGLGWLLADRRAAAAARSLRAHALAYSAAFAIAGLAPSALLHLQADHEWRATMSAGQVFHQGHRPEDSGVRAHYPALMKLVEALRAVEPGHPPDYAHELYRRFASGAAGEVLPAAEAERFWLGKAASFAAEEPWAYLRHLGRKWVFTVVAPSPGADIAGVQRLAQERAPFPWLPYEWLALAGLGGLLLALRGDRVERLLGLYVVTYQLICVTFYYQTRYGVAILPAWCGLAGCAAAALWDARRQPTRLARRLVVAAAPLALLSFSWVRSEARLEQRHLLVPVDSEVPRLRAEGRWAEARERFLDEQASFPDYVWPLSPRGYGLAAGSPDSAMRAAERARARFGVGRPTDSFLVAVLYAQAGRCDLALPLADRAAAGGFHGTVEDTDLGLDPDLLASDCLLELHQPEVALARVARSLQRWPGTLEGLARRVAAAGARPDLAGADGERWEKALFALHDPASAHYALARARRRWGDPTRALADANAVAALVPEAAPLALFERALCLLDLGRDDDALYAYARSLRIPYYAYGAGRFDPLIRALLERHPTVREANLFALRHWLRQGDREEARAILARHPGLAGAVPP